MNPKRSPFKIKVMSVPIGLWKHLRTGNLYFVEGLARSTIKPSQQVVVYSQNYRSQLQDTDIILKEGSMWTRDHKEFLTKFEKVPEDDVEKLFGMLRSNLNRWEF